MPRIVDHDQRRREICDVLLDAVAEIGIASVTLRGVAERGGWTTGVITHYFKSRRDLLLGGLRRAAEVLAEYNRNVLGTLDGLPAIEHLLEGSMPMDRRRLALCRIFFFFYTEAMHQEDLRLEIEHYLCGWRGAVARAIRRSQELGDLPDTLDPRQAAIDLTGMADGLSIHALMDPRVMERVLSQSPIRTWIRNIACASQSQTPLTQAASRAKDPVV